jgi:hypothetical protein
LEEAILGSDYALGEEQIVLVLRINVGDAPAIAQNVDGSLQSRHPQLAGDYGQGLMGGTDEIGFRGGLGENCEGKQKDQQADGFHPRTIVMPPDRLTVGRPGEDARRSTGEADELN